MSVRVGCEMHLRSIIHQFIGLVWAIKGLRNRLFALLNRGLFIENRNFRPEWQFGSTSDGCSIINAWTIPD